MLFYVAQKNPFVDEIVVVNDGSTDKTPLLQRKWVLI